MSGESERLEAAAVLERVGAPSRLVRHGELVAEAAEEILEAVAPLVPVNPRIIRLGARLHDAGKTLHPSELSEPGSAHEDAGEALLLSHGVEPKLARMCRTHAQWQTMVDVALEDLLVALADKLWKGKRDAALEEHVVDTISAHAAKERWEVFTLLDEVFERVATRGPERLARSLR